MRQYIGDVCVPSLDKHKYERFPPVHNCAFTLLMRSMLFSRGGGNRCTVQVELDHAELLEAGSPRRQWG